MRVVVFRVRFTVAASDIWGDCTICWYTDDTMEPVLFVALCYLLVVLACVSTIFLLAILLDDNSIMDVFYGPIYLIATTATLSIVGATALTVYVMVGCVALWSLRLGFRIWRKNYGKPEDARYATWRTQWHEHGHVYFVIRSYLQVFILQGLVITAVSLPIIVILAYQFIPAYFLYAGLAVWAVGLILESTADWQLDRFIARKKAGTESANLMTTGLFRYSRRPNYFGETLIWWGLAIMALSLPFGTLALIGPITITYVVTRLTGPMLEDMFAKKFPEDFAAYKARTSYFIPWFPKP